MSNLTIIREFITSNLVSTREKLELNDDDHLFEQGFVNSLFAMKLLTFIENKFNIDITPSEMNLENFSTINNICTLVNGKIKA